MDSKSYLFSFVLVVLCSCSHAQNVEENDVNLSKGYMDTFLCFLNRDAWDCVQETAARTLDSWDVTLDNQRMSFAADADAEVAASANGRSIEQQPSTIARGIEDVLGEVTELMAEGVTSFLNRKKEVKPAHHHKPEVDHAHIDDIHDVHLHDEHEVHQPSHHEHGSHNHPGDNHGRAIGDKRGKKKKKRKALMRLFLLGAILKSKIGLLLQILSAHLQMKFFAIAVIGLLINVARFWIDLKKGHQPQKVIYYEHAQHQHHYDDHGDEGYGGGYWKRSIDEQSAHELAYNGNQSNSQ